MTWFWKWKKWWEMSGVMKWHTNEWIFPEKRLARFGLDFCNLWSAELYIDIKHRQLATIDRIEIFNIFAWLWLPPLQPHPHQLQPILTVTVWICDGQSTLLCSITVAIWEADEDGCNQQRLQDVKTSRIDPDDLHVKSMMINRNSIQTIVFCTVCHPSEANLGS